MKQNAISLNELPLPDTTSIERQVLTNAVFEPYELTDYIGIITPEMFSDDKRRKIWDIIVKRFNAGEQVAITSIHTILTKAELYEVTAEGIRAESFAGREQALLLRDAAARRRAYEAAMRTLYMSCDPMATEDEIIAEIAAAAQSVESGSLRPNESGLPEVINAVAEDLQEWKQNAATGKRTRIPTGFYNLDNLMNQGWKGGQLIILAARPSIGKTAVMLHFAKTAATYGFNAGIFTLEMTKKEIVSRLLFSTGRISPSAFYDGSVQWEDFEGAAGQISNLPIVINDTANRMAELLSRMTALHNRGKCDIAFIDYLGLIRNESNGRTPLYQVIAENTATLKSTAKKLDIPIVLLCQLNRDAAQDGQEPQLYHLRDSGGIEQDADVVMMLQPTDHADPDLPPDINLWIRKNRNGDKNLAIVLGPDKSYTQFNEKDLIR